MRCQHKSKNLEGTPSLLEAHNLKSQQKPQSFYSVSQGLSSLVKPDLLGSLNKYATEQICIHIQLHRVQFVISLSSAHAFFKK